MKKENMNMPVKSLSIAILLLALGAAQASAALNDPDMIRSSATAISPISVSSAAATQVDGSGRKLNGRFVAVIDNEGADHVRCGFSNAVTQTANGFLVRAGTQYVIKLGPGIDLWCRAVGSSPVDVSLAQGVSQ